MTAANTTSSAIPPSLFSGSQAAPVACQPIAGAAPDALLWQLETLDIERLRVDLAQAAGDFDWSCGPYGHGLPLTSSRLTEFGASHYNNLVETSTGERGAGPEVLTGCPYFQEVFESFRCDKSSFRILRRPAGSSYSLHKDEDIGKGIVRMQVPIRTNDQVHLLVSTTSNRDDFAVPGNADYRKVSDWHKNGLNIEQMRTWFDAFVALNAECVSVYQLEAGKLYFFNVLNYHNVWNFGNEARYTLGMDLVANSWLADRYPVIRDFT